MLKSLIYWVKTDFSYQDIVEQISYIKKELIIVEQHIISSSNIKESKLDVKNLSETDLASRIYSILINKVFRTFPEQYRWKDD